MLRCHVPLGQGVMAGRAHGGSWGAHLRIVRYEERAAAGGVHKVLERGAGDRDAVVRRRPPPELVQDHLHSSAGSLYIADLSPT